LGILAEKDAYKTVLNTDESKFGGFNLIDNSIVHFTDPPTKDSLGKETRVSFVSYSCASKGPVLIFYIILTRVANPRQRVHENSFHEFFKTHKNNTLHTKIS